MESKPDNTPATPAAAVPGRRGRRWGRRFAIGSLIAIAAAGIGFKLFHHHGWHRGASDPSQVESHVNWMLKRFYSRIDATEVQRQKIGPIVQAAARDLLPLRDRLRAARGQAATLLAAPAFDRAAVERLRQDQIRLADEASKRLMQAIADTAEVLTAEQRRELAARLGRHAGWHQA